MLNTYDLLKLIPATRENLDALSQIKEDFIKDFNRYNDGFHLNKSTRAAALKSLQGGSQGRLFADSKIEGLYATQYALYMIKDAANITGAEMDISNIMKAHLKDRRPVDYMYIADTIPTARALGWKPSATQEDAPFYFKIDNNYYWITFIYQALQIIALNKKQYIRCELSFADARHPALCLSADNGTAFILPNIAPPFKRYEVDFMNVINTYEDIESEIIANIRKGA